MKKSIFLHVDCMLHVATLIVIYWGRTWSKMGVVILRSQDSKIGCISVRKLRVTLKIQKSYFNNFWVVVVKNWHGILLGHGTLKSGAS